MRRVIRQIYRLLKLCITGPGGRLGLVLYGVVLALELSQIFVSLRMIEWSKSFYDALQQLNADEALRQVGVFGLIVIAAVSLTLGSTYVRKHLEIRWRRTLTAAALDRWLGGKAYLRLETERRAASGEPGLDNPDQRIAEDCRFFLAGPMSEHGGGIGFIPLSLDLITNVVAIFSYLAVLWSLSTFSLSLTPIGVPLEIPHYMVWAAFLYVIVSTGLTHFLGRPLKGLYFQQQRREADFRFGLVRVRENADPIALSGGEKVERRDLDGRFGGIITNWKKLINAELKLMSFTHPYRFTVLRIPTFLALPAFFAGSVTFGGLMQLASAFSQVVTTLSWFIFAYRPLADLLAATSRLDSFLNAAGDTPVATVAPGLSPEASGEIALDNVRVTTPEGRPLLAIEALRVQPGEALWLSGVSGLGKTTLFKFIAGLWAHASGRISNGGGRQLYLPQKLYFPEGTLRDGAAYPGPAGDFDAVALDEAVRAVGLGHRLDAGAVPHTLSTGEQQRLALARLLVHRPAWAFLDEATSALDLRAEEELLSLLRRSLPGTAFVIVAHREPRGIGALRTVALTSAASTHTAPEPVPA